MSLPVYHLQTGAVPRPSQTVSLVTLTPQGLLLRHPSVPSQPATTAVCGQVATPTTATFIIRPVSKTLHEDDVFNVSMQSPRTPQMSYKDYSDVSIISSPQSGISSCSEQVLFGSSSVQLDVSSSSVANTSSQSTESSDEDSIRIEVHNVVGMFTTKCHVDLRAMALHGSNVVYDRSKGVLVKQLRRPKCHVKIFSSGKVILTGSKSEVDARVAARYIGRLIQKYCPKAKFAQYRIINIFACCKLPCGIDIRRMAADNPKHASYEPELDTGLIWKSKEPKATIRIHTTGNMTITGATSVEAIEQVVETVYPVLFKYQVPLSQLPSVAAPSRAAISSKKRQRKSLDDSDEEEFSDTSFDEVNSEDEEFYPKKITNAVQRGNGPGERNLTYASAQRTFDARYSKPYAKRGRLQ